MTSWGKILLLIKPGRKCSHQTFLSWLLIMSFYRIIRTIEQYCDQTDTWESVGRIPKDRSFFKCDSLWLSKDA